MSVPPAIVRELRAESRNAVNSWLRVAGAAIVILVLTLLLIDQRSTTRIDPIVFQSLHVTILVLIWLLVPAMTADCIARERREGTLGLLFLTPLTAGQIVIGKACVHFLRALTFFFAALPMLTVPLLLGGVSWLDLVSASAIQLTSVLLALTSGLLASAYCKNANRALFLAQIFAATSVLLSLALVTFCTGLFASMFQPSIAAYQPYPALLWRSVSNSLELMTGLGRGWAWFASNIPHLKTIWMGTLAVTLLFAILLFRVALSIAATRIKKSWRDESLSKRQLWFIKTFCTPQFLRSIFKRSMSRTLQSNPISWLQQYSWSARLSKWGWCFFIVVVETILISSNLTFRTMTDIQSWLAIALIAGATFSAAASFRQERQNGALELLLVTPLTEGQIVFGRLWGLWKQIIPAALIFFFSAIGFAQTDRYSKVFWLWGVASTFVSVPLIGLFLSLQFRHFLTSWLLTVLTAIFLPYFVIVVWAVISEKLGSPQFREFSDAFATMIVLQLMFAAAACGLLMRNLKGRRFVLAPG